MSPNAAIAPVCDCVMTVLAAKQALRMNISSFSFHNRHHPSGQCRRSGYQSITSMMPGSGTAIGLESSASANHPFIAHHQPTSDGRSASFTCAYKLARMKAAHSNVLRSAIHATDSTCSG